MAPGHSVSIMEPVHQEVWYHCEVFKFSLHAAFSKNKANSTNPSLARTAWPLHPVGAQLIGLPSLFASHRGSPQGDYGGQKEVEEEIGKQ